MGRPGDNKRRQIATDSPCAGLSASNCPWGLGRTKRVWRGGSPRKRVTFLSRGPKRRPRPSRRSGQGWSGRRGYCGGLARRPGRGAPGARPTRTPGERRRWGRGTVRQRGFPPGPGGQRLRPARPAPREPKPAAGRLPRSHTPALAPTGPTLSSVPRAAGPRFPSARLRQGYEVD